MVLLSIYYVKLHNRDHVQCHGVHLFRSFFFSTFFRRFVIKNNSEIIKFLKRNSFPASQKRLMQRAEVTRGNLDLSEDPWCRRACSRRLPRASSVHLWWSTIECRRRARRLSWALPTTCARATTSTFCISTRPRILTSCLCPIKYEHVSLLFLLLRKM